ncbi:MbtH family protein [Streptomyces sp. NPDC014889]|uniref:MbtH family protein n=1 Tax=Streptomyces sp. NPDC014889 TaxID=3364928 RepID=UPI0036FE6EF3
MSTNPFEDNEAEYYVLVNDEGQHSLWPAFAEVPAGWTVAHGRAGREACLEYVNENWTDMRPLSLVREMEAAAGK